MKLVNVNQCIENITGKFELNKISDYILSIVLIGISYHQGYHGITEEVFLSLPVVVGENGITAVFNQKLSEAEAAKVLSSAKTLHEVIKGIVL